MDAEQIRQLRPQLTEFLAEFSDCFARRDTRAHFPRYIEGQLSDLPRKSVEPMALKADVPVRTLQEFLSQHCWDNDRMRDRVQQIVMRDHHGEHSIGLIDETSFVKKGEKTPGVQRQHCGAVGKQEESPRHGASGLCVRRLSLLDRRRLVPAGKLVSRSPALPGSGDSRRGRVSIQERHRAGAAPAGHGQRRAV